MQNTIEFLKSIPAAAWTLLGVLVGGTVTLGIDAIRGIRRRRAVSEIMFQELQHLLVHTSNLIGQAGHEFVLRADPKSPDYPFLIQVSLFSQSTLSAHKVSETLARELFIQKRHLTVVAWTLGKLEVAEVARVRCVQTLSSYKDFVPAWYQYCLALQEFANGSYHALMTLYDLSHSSLTKPFRLRKRRRIEREVNFCLDSVQKGFGDFYNIFERLPKTEPNKGRTVAATSPNKRQTGARTLHRRR